MKNGTVGSSALYPWVSLRVGIRSRNGLSGSALSDNIFIESIARAVLLWSVPDNITRKQSLDKPSQLRK